MRTFTSLTFSAALVVACSRPAPVEPEPVAAEAAVRSQPDAGVANDAPPVLANVLRTRFVKIEVVGAHVIGTLPVGSDQGIAKEWTGCLVLGSSDRCHPGGALVIVRLEPHITRVRMGPLEMETVTANPDVLLTAPP